MPEEAKKRHTWFEYYEKCGRNARKTCRHFGISPDTFYRWKKRYRPNDPSSLENGKKSCMPKQKRYLTISGETADRKIKGYEAYISLLNLWDDSQTPKA